MNLSEQAPISPDPIEAAVRTHLDAEAARVNAPALLASVKARLMAQPESIHRRAWLRWVAAGAGSAVAAGIATVAFLSDGGPAPTRELSARELLEEAKLAHETLLDRCYEVTADWDLAPFQRRFPFRPPTRKVLLWTRGDQFFVLSGEEGATWAWGQEQSGRVWITPSRKRALVYEADELNEPLVRYCELMSLRMVSAIAEWLDKYDLRREPNGPGQFPRVSGTFRPGLQALPHLRNRQLTVELDSTTKVIQRVVLNRELNGEPLGTLTFQFLESLPQPDDQYTLSGHIDANAIIHDGSPLVPPIPPKFPPKLPADDPRAKLRDELLRRFLNRPLGKL